MAVHCSSNVILLAIEYFIDSKGETDKRTQTQTQTQLKTTTHLRLAWKS